MINSKGINHTSLKRLLAVLLAVCFMVSTVPISANAASYGSGETANISSFQSGDTVAPGTIVTVDENALRGSVSIYVRDPSTNILEMVFSQMLESRGESAVIPSETSLFGSTRPFDVISFDHYTDHSVGDEIFIAVFYATLKPILVNQITVAANGEPSVGNDFPVFANVSPTNAHNQEVTWSVENGTGEATISESGVLSPTKAGTVTVKATAKDGGGAEGVRTFTITDALLVSGIELTTTNGMTLQAGSSIGFTANFTPAAPNNNALNWSVSPSDMGTMNKTTTPHSTSKVKNVFTSSGKVGTATITAEAVDGSGSKTSVEVKVVENLVYGETVYIEYDGDDKTTLGVGESLQLGVVVKPDNTTEKGVVWSVTDGTGSATIDEAGMLTGVTAGTIKVKAVLAVSNPDLSYKPSREKEYTVTEHTHTASTQWSKDETGHWHECTAGDGEKMDSAPHVFGDWVIETPATATAEGSKYRECVCGQKETAEIPPHTHTAATDWSQDATGHWHACTAGDGEKLDLAAHSFGDWVIDRQPTETEAGSKHRDCKVCPYRMSETIPATAETPEKPTVTVGSGSTYVIESGKSVTFSCTGELEDLTGIYLDGSLVDESHYSLKSGSTILTLKTEFLDTLSVGSHTLKFQYKSGVSAETTFTVSAAGTPTPTPAPTSAPTSAPTPTPAPTEKPVSGPQTGDSSNPLLLLTVLLASGGIAAALLVRRRKAGK